MFISEYYCPVTSPNSVRPGIDNPIGMLRDHDGDGEFSENEIFIFTKDHLNSVRDLTNMNQRLVQRYNYSAYGKVKLERIADASDVRFVENYFTYTAREWEPEVGEYFFRARYYNPSTGQFLSSDPIEFEAGDTNFYRYVLNNPLNATDPFGTSGILGAPQGFYPMVTPSKLQSPIKNSPPSLLQKSMHLMNKETTPQNEGRILNDFLDNVFKKKDNEYNHLNCPQA